ncbi:MAG TPA: sialidase family protein [Chloroflexota bacterium]|nr:sialidase family protein [Chloroflexota bacterium]
MLKRVGMALAVTAWLGFTAIGGTASAGSSITQISSDPFSAPTVGQHHTQVEPDIYAYGGTVVADVQQGRIDVGGSTDPGWATFNGSSWQHGSFPGLTVNSSPPGPYDEASDPSIVYDAKHKVWLASTLAMKSEQGVGVAVNQSTDGITWKNAVTAFQSSDFEDKDWITCDNGAKSPFYGNCYIEFDDVSQGDQPYMMVSHDGGTTWSSPVSAGSCCLGGEPLVQPKGTVIVPLLGPGGVSAFSSKDGGKTWGPEVTVANINANADPGSIRNPDLPSATIDKSGKVYVFWQDCRFESGCGGSLTNDIVMSTSTNGTKWSSPVRVPTASIGSGTDFLLPGAGADPSTSGKKAKIALDYYYFPNANSCGSNCQLDVGFVSSTNGGKSWSSPTQLAGPMQTTWLANTNQGYMVGDYFQTAVSNGTAYPALVVANPPNGSVYDEALYSAAIGVVGGSVTAGANERVQGLAPRHGDPHSQIAN